MEAKTSRLLWIVGTDCTDPNREEEFNKWYNEIHVPDIREVGGKNIPKVLRYKNKNPQPGEPEYIAIYEFDTDDPAALLDKLAVAYGKWKEQGRTIDYLKRHWTILLELVADF